MNDTPDAAAAAPSVAAPFASASDRLKVERAGHVLVLTIDDPATRNALSGDDLYAAFEAVVRYANADLGIRALVLTGAGTAFSSGGNVRDMHERKGMFGGAAHEIAEQYRTGIQRIPRALLDLDVPAIAAVNGPAIGAGCDLACMCDVRIASERALFAESFVKVGLVAGDGGAIIWPQLIGFARAKELLMTGEMLTAARAAELGLVNHVVPAAHLDARVAEVAAKILANPRWAVRWTKTVTNIPLKALAAQLSDPALAYEVLSNLTADRREAVAAFVGKRPPSFTGE
jgi:2-(1,2-epoxy-1,2-dihydrophenyl)acetyl-CoA isomerase